MKFFGSFYRGFLSKKHCLQSKEPLLSIVIPTQNSASSLSLALETIKNQTFKNIEVLIIDGASSDYTLEIADSYKSDFRFYTLVSEPDKGIYDAMNKGVKLAKGEWLYFMGCDDSLYTPGTLEEIFSLPKIRNYDVIYGNVNSSRFEGPYDGEFSYSKLAVKNICHQSIILRKSIFKKTGKFDLRYKALADWDHNIKWFYSSGISRIYIDKIIANYADGGFSSLFIDKKFHEVKDLKILKTGFNKLPKNVLIDICENAIIQAKQKNSIFIYRFLRVIKTALKIEKSIKYRWTNNHFKF